MITAFHMLVLYTMLCMHYIILYTKIICPCPVYPHTQAFSQQHLLLVVLQVINTGVRRPAYEASLLSGCALASLYSIREKQIYATAYSISI